MAANKQTLQTTSQFLKSVSVLSPLTDQQRSTLASAMEETAFEDGEYVVSMGEPADALFLLKSGEVAVHKANDDGDLMRMEPGGRGSSELPLPLPPTTLTLTLPP